MKTNNSKKLALQVFLSMLFLVAGSLLMVFKICEDGEPGAIPLLLIAIGAGWYLTTRLLYNKQNHLKTRKDNIL